MAMFLANPIRNLARLHAQRAFSTATRTNSRAAPVSQLTDVQKALWMSYLATGRGSAALFGSIDSDCDGVLKLEELKSFLDSAQLMSGILPRVFRLLDTAQDHPLSFHEFQEWLVTATQDKIESDVQRWYEIHPEVGERRSKDLHVKMPKPEYTWNASTMSQSLRRMQYAVRGEVVMLAEKLAAEGRDIIYTNIGNPQAIGQPPITYYRQVLSLCDLPQECGVDHPNAHQIFSPEVIAHARELRALVGQSGTGAYTHSQGLSGVRRHVADFIEQRDGHPAYQGDIFLTNGASSAIDMILSALISCNHDAIMIPIPQYPIYSALITHKGGHQVGYELDESRGWGVTREELDKRLDNAKASGLNIKGMALINPGNPTGQVMTRQDLEVVCIFCAENGIVLLADEVYQRNVYVDDKKFVSTKKVALETPGCDNLQLVSFHSTSKGLIGECGRRGGYMELHHIDPYVQSQIYKLASSGLCSGVAGQIMTSLMVKGPEPGTASYDLFKNEENKIYEGLKRRSKALVDGLNRVDGIECQRAEGAMYAFPRIYLPPKAIAKAETSNQTPDTLYAVSLLNETGICVVPASGFGQKEGRCGFRTTFLPGDEQLEKAIEEFSRHHEFFCDMYS